VTFTVTVAPEWLASIGVTTRRRLQSSPFDPIAAAVASSLGGIPVENVVVTLITGTTTLNVEVIINDGASAATGVTGVGTGAPSFSAASITSTINDADFASVLTVSMADQGLPAISAADLVLSEPVLEFTVVMAPSPPPPAPPPPPPAPLEPAEQLLSHSTSSSGIAQPAGGAAAAANDGEDGIIVALIFASIATVIFVLVFPVMLIFMICYLKKYRGGVRIDPKELLDLTTAIVPVVNAPPTYPRTSKASTQRDDGVDEAAGVIPTAGASPSRSARMSAGAVIATSPAPLSPRAAASCGAAEVDYAAGAVPPEVASAAGAVPHIDTSQRASERASRVRTQMSPRGPVALTL